jgi:predicted nucleotidyltransferase
MPQANLEQLGDYLASRPDVICAVVFGSAQNGIVQNGSDLDLGIYFTAKPEGEGYVDFLVEAAEACEFDVIDLVDLQSADPILAFEAISGRFICKTDPEKTAELASRISREYEDTMLRLGHAA